VHESIEGSFTKHIDSVRKDIFEIFSQIPTEKSDSKTLTIDNELDSLKSQIREMRMKNQESFQQSSFIHPIEQLNYPSHKKISTADFSQRSRRNIMMSGGHSARNAPTIQTSGTHHLGRQDRSIVFDKLPVQQANRHVHKGLVSSDARF